VVLLDSLGHPKALAMSDSVGRYSVQVPASGRYKLLVAASGFDPVQTPEMAFESASVLNLDIKVSPVGEATQLEKVVVEGEKPIVHTSLANPHKYDDFLLRRKLGIGTFLTREQIEAKPVTQTPQIFSQIAGLKVRQHGTEWYIQSQRCPAKLSGGRELEDMDDPDPWLYPILFVDGHQIKGLKFLSSISPNEIEAIEVYQGAAQLPADAKGDACAAIYIWLKSAR
jgi:hypothetical protein